MPSANSTLGILALQGNVDQHSAVLTLLGIPHRRLRRPEELAGLAGLIIPGGESTTVNHLFSRLGWWEPLTVALAGGLPAFGTCMGAILLAKTVLPTHQQSLGVLDIDVARNAYGSQVESFWAEIPVEGFATGAPITAHFIRAPRITRVGPEVAVLARAGEEPVVVRQGSLLAATFHPEVHGDTRLHRYFAETLCGLDVSEPRGSSGGPLV